MLILQIFGEEKKWLYFSDKMPVQKQFTNSNQTDQSCCSSVSGSNCSQLCQKLLLTNLLEEKFSVFIVMYVWREEELMPQNIVNSNLVFFRPHELENICLAEHCSFSPFSFKIRNGLLNTKRCCSLSSICIHIYGNYLQQNNANNNTEKSDGRKQANATVFIVCPTFIYHP